MTTAEHLAAARTLLFVPGHRPDRFAKAAASGADARPSWAWTRRTATLCNTPGQ